MDDKTALLTQLRQAVQAGTLTADEVRQTLAGAEPAAAPWAAPVAPAGPAISPPLAPAQPLVPVAADSQRQADDGKLNMVELLYYLAGGVLYGAIATLAFQGSDNDATMRISVLLGSGTVLWLLVFLLARRFRTQSDRPGRSGFLDAMTLAGAFSIITGGYILAAELIADNSSKPSALYVVAVTSAVLGGLHILFDFLVRRTVLIVLGLLLLVAAFPLMVSGMLQSAGTMSVDVWAVVGCATGVFLAAAGRIAAHSAPGREYLGQSFISLSVFVVLSSVYVASTVSEVAVLWLVVLAGLIYAAIYASVKQRSRQFLLTGSFFLVVLIGTIAFKYFAGFGVAFALVLSAAALLGTAFMASSINQRYIKTGR